MFLLLVSGLIGLIISSRMMMFTSFGCAMLLAVFLKNASNSQLKNPKLNQEVRISGAHLNLSLITDAEDVVKVIKDPEIEFISFQEYTPDWGNIIPSLAGTEFPFSYQDIRMDIYGKALYSKNRIVDSSLIFTNKTSQAILGIEKNGEKFTVVTTYITPALDKRSKEVSRQELIALGDSIMKLNTNLLVLGEFNQVYWSSPIIDFRKKTSLQISRRSVNPSNFRMPYDHIFYSKELECINFSELDDQSGNHIGSKASFQILKKKKSYQ
jgi:hypothetical protein